MAERARGASTAAAKPARAARASRAPAADPVPLPRRRGRPPGSRSGEAGVPDDIRNAVARLKRDHIVASAVELFYRQGYERTTLEQVAVAMRVTKPFIYAHFASKAELLAEICSRAIRHANDGLERILADVGSHAERLERVVRDFMVNVLDNQAHAVIYSREETELQPRDRDAINKLRRNFDHKLIALLESGVAAGEFNIDDVPVTALAIGAIVGWAPVWFRPGGRLSKLESAEKSAALVLNMVKARRPPVRRSRKVDSE